MTTGANKIAIRKKGWLAGGLGLSVLLCGFLLSVTAMPALASHCRPCGCVNTEHSDTRCHIRVEHKATRTHVTNEFKAHHKWFLDNAFFTGHIAPAWMAMTQQLTTTGMMQVFAVGAFLDAKNQLETQALFQDLTARAHKKYHPDNGMCVIGTNVRSLAAADRNAQLTSHVLGERLIERQLGNIGTAAAAGRDDDRRARIDQLKNRFCDPNDNNGQLGLFCDSSTKSHMNKDIDFTRTVGGLRTIDLDLSNESATDDEKDVFALASNLYGHDVFERVNRMTVESDGGADNNKSQNYLDLRAVVAKRSVAQNSFNSIVGMKGAGTAQSEETGKFAAVALKNLGIEDEEEIARYLGGGDEDNTRPSYYAFMEILSQKLYQDPTFFVNLYDKPANVLRKNVGMQAINLMLDRDALKSDLRTEAVLAVWLELEVIRQQEIVSNRLGKMNNLGKEPGK